MSKIKFSITPAIRFLRDHQVAFSVHPYSYEERGGTAHSAHCLGVDEHCVIKTLIMENDQRQPLIVLMHGNHKVSTRELARLLGVKTIHPCDPATAHKHSGYLVGGTSPFGTRKSMSVYLEESILELPLIYLNGGRRGLLISLASTDVRRLLQPVLVNVAIED